MAAHLWYNWHKSTWIWKGRRGWGFGRCHRQWTLCPPSHPVAFSSCSHPTSLPLWCSLTCSSRSSWSSSSGAQAALHCVLHLWQPKSTSWCWNAHSSIISSASDWLLMKIDCSLPEEHLIQYAWKRFQIQFLMHLNRLKRTPFWNLGELRPICVDDVDLDQEYLNCGP